MAGKKGVQRRAWTPEDVARLRDLASKTSTAEVDGERGGQDAARVRARTPGGCAQEDGAPGDRKWR